MSLQQGQGSLYGEASTPEEQRAALTSGEIPVAVYGLGKMGLPLAAVFAEVTGNVIGVDIDPDVVGEVSDGGCPITREPGLSELLSDVVERSALVATVDGQQAATEAAVHVIIVPTLLTRSNQPDLSMLEAALHDVASGLDPGDLILIESTVPPRTCADVVAPLLEREGEVEAGEFGVAACPERTLSGQALADIRGTHPKIVGGIDAESTRAAALIYGEITSNEVITTTDATTAEAVKVFEGVYRDVNIALANELALYASPLDIDVNEAIAWANTQPFCDIHSPGAGVGGHCIPVYPYFLANQFDVDARVLTAARARNDSMPDHTIELLEAALSKRGNSLDGTEVVLLGLTYKANVAEARYSPAGPIIESLSQAGATVAAVDPVLGDWREFDRVERVTLDALDTRSFDVALLLAAHDEFDGLDWSAVADVIVDGRNGISSTGSGVDVYTVGGRWP